MHIYTHMYIYIYTDVYVCMYTYIYIDVNWSKTPKREKTDSIFSVFVSPFCDNAT